MVNVIGLGYIGLPTALMLKANGIEITGTDYSVQLLDCLSSGRMTFSEDGMEQLLTAAVKDGILFSERCVCADLYIIAVQTPYDPTDKKVDTSYIESAVTDILRVCPQDALIVLESTVPPGTIDSRIRPLVKLSEKKIHLAHAPERILPGNMLSELKSNSRVIGVEREEDGAVLKRIYSSFCRGDIVITDIRTAELTKVVENTFRDLNIAFANELAKLCDSIGIDVYETIRIANLHPRVNILKPGPGVGGHCIPVDPWFLVGDYPDLTPLIKTARLVNDSMPRYVTERLFSIMKENGIDSLNRVGLYGLTYKENVDDTRESPARQILKVLNSRQCDGEVKLYDPYITKKMWDNQLQSFNSFLEQVDLVVVLISHNQIVNESGKLNGKIVFDTTKNIFTENVYKL